MIQKYLVSNQMFYDYFFGFSVCKTMKGRYKNALQAIKHDTWSKDKTKIISIKKVKRLKTYNNQYHDYSGCNVYYQWNNRYNNDIWIVTIDTEDTELLTRPIQNVHHKNNLCYLYGETKYGLKGGFQRIA